MTKAEFRMENQWKMPMNAKSDNEINDGYPLGKGEVDSSILSGSTRKAQKSEGFVSAPADAAALSRRTRCEPRSPTRGESVDSVPQPFCTWCGDPLRKRHGKFCCTTCGVGGALDEAGKDR
jgi:hypothetical protein